MKRRLAAILACVLAVSSLAACGTDDTTASESNGTVSAGTETTSTGSSLAGATVVTSAEIVETEEGTGLHEIPVEDYVFLGQYKNLALSVTAKTEYTDEEIDEAVAEYFLSDLSYADTSLFATEGTVAEGDYILMDFEGKIDGEVFDGGTATDSVLLIGSGTYIDGFEEGLVGVKVGETVDLELTFPEDYWNTDYAGKEVVFSVTVKGMTQFTDEAVAGLGYSSIKTVDEYREGIAYMYEYEAENGYYSNLTYAICDALLTNCAVSKIPSNYFEAQKAYVIEQVESEASYYGVDGDTYTYAFMGVNLTDYAITVAEEYAKQAVIFQAIANAENLNPTEEDVDAYVADFIEYYGETYGITTADDLYEVYSDSDIRLMIMQENVINFIIDSATITEVSADAE